MKNDPCPCGTNKALEACCLPLIDGKLKASSPEVLMRSRYTAFCLHRMEYVRDTTDPQALHEFDLETNKAWAAAVKFQRLEILSAREDGTKGFVEFKAYFTPTQPESAEAEDSPLQIHHEQSKFRKQNGTWFFRDGKNIPTPPAPEK